MNSMRIDFKGNGWNWFGSVRSSVRCLIVHCCAIVGISCNMGWAEQFDGRARTHSNVSNELRLSAPPGLCGIYSLFATAQALGTSPDLVDFVEPQYLTAAQGSTMADLILAAQANGLDARPVSGLSVHQVAKLSTPAILHVRPRGQQEVFSHWVAYLGVNPEGSLRIFDSSYGMKKWDKSELAGRFNGVAILISTDQAALDGASQDLFFDRAKQAVIWAGLLLILTLVVSVISIRFSNWSGVIAIGALLVAGVTSVVYHSVQPEGLLNDRMQVARQLAAASSLTFPEVDFAEMMRVVAERDSNVALLDARYGDAYQRGTIPGAMNYPLDIHPSTESELIAELRQKQRVIVFCHSESCPWGGMIARQISAMGVDNISLYPGGYKEWRDLNE